jgi:hypothetical protein
MVVHAACGTLEHRKTLQLRKIDRAPAATKKKENEKSHFVVPVK